MTTEIRTTSPESFDAEVLHADGPVLVDFHAEWCAPCQAMAPVIADLAQRYRGQVDVLKVDVDRSPSLARRYGVRGIPTLMLFSNGEVAESIVGAASARRLGSLIETHAGAR
ncbi:MAG: thioredoxin [Gammaproteobacteria bacterium]|nr:thioredoxin [Gammaproteobacteria bacterium]